MDEYAPMRGREKGAPGRLRLIVGGRSYPVVESHADGCLIHAADAADMRGYADLYDGDRHLAQCLIVLAAPDGELVRCAYKRRTLPRDAPPRDFA